VASLQFTATPQHVIERKVISYQNQEKLRIHMNHYEPPKKNRNSKIPLSDNSLFYLLGIAMPGLHCSAPVLSALLPSMGIASSSHLIGSSQQIMILICFDLFWGMMINLDIFIIIFPECIGFAAFSCFYFLW
jgi:hypothetical protein